MEEANANAVSFLLLGPLTALRGGEALDLGRPKQRAALALLLLAPGRVVSTDRLIEAVWEGDPPPSALAGLQAYISNLRRILRDSAGASSAIVRRGPGYVLDVPADRVDVARFAAAAREAREAVEAQRWADALDHVEAALARWKGALLADLADQAWVRPEADALEELRTECRETQITALLALGRMAPALVAAAELRADQPLRDRACWLHVVALHRAGRSPEALEQYRLYAERLDAELGLEPGLELRELQVAVLRHDPALAGWPRPAGWTGATRIETPAPAAATVRDDEADGDPLVGRDAEAAVLDAVLAEAAAGEPRWLLLTGGAGIGKTRLAEELARRTRAAGGADAWARCPEEDGSPAWWPIRQLVRALGEDPDRVLLAPPEADADAARFTLYERIAELVRTIAVARPPLLVVVDDVQWADRTSARCLAYLAGALRDVPALFALTLRADEDRSAVAPLLSALARGQGARQLDVGPLNAAAVGRLAASVSGAPLGEAEAGELAARTGGNPLFVSEYARLPADERRRGTTPLAVRAVLDRRLGGLDDALLEVLRAAAVLGDVIDVAALAALTDTDPDTLADQLDAAADEHVVVAAAGAAGYAFAHGLVREAVLAGIPEQRRRRLHARAAAALAGAADGDAVSDRARHLVAALPSADPAEVLAACRAAALLAERRFSSETAADWWAEALRAYDLLPDGAAPPEERDALLAAHVAALARAGRGQAVLDVLDAGLLDAVRTERPATVGQLAASLLRSAGAWPWTAFGDDPGPLIQRLTGLEAFVAADPAAHARLLAALAVGRCYDPDPTIPDALSRRALDEAEALGDDAVLGDALLGRLISYSGVASHAEECVAIARRLGAGLDHPEARVDAAVGLNVAAMAQLNLGDVAQAERDTAGAIVQSDLLRLPVLRVQLRWMEGTLALWRGDREQAARHFAAAGRVHAQTELSYTGSAVLAHHCLLRDAGELAGADLDGSPEPVAWGAAIAAARDERAEAERLLVAWLDDLGAAWTWPTLGHVTLLAGVAADLDLADHAPRLLALLAPYARHVATIGQVGVVDAVDLAAGRLHALLGDAAAARAALDRALAHARATGGAPTAARCGRALDALAR
jgi:DNA-binding SARP family transcriptional activator